MTTKKYVINEDALKTNHAEIKDGVMNVAINSRPLTGIAARIEQAKDYKAAKIGRKISWSALAQEVGLTVTAPNNWKKGRVSKETLEKLAEYTGTNFTWLVTGEGEMISEVNKARTALGYIAGTGIGGIAAGATLGAVAGPIGLAAGAIAATAFDAIGRKISDTRLQKALEQLENENPNLVDEIKQDIESAVEKQLTSDIKNVQKIQENGIRLVPLISFVQAGSFKEAVLNAQDQFVATYAHDLGRYSFALEIVGDSMYPEFKPGDKIIVDPDVKPMPGDFVIAQNDDHEATFKKYKPRGFDENGREYFELTPINDNYAKLDSRFQNIQIIATVIDHIRKLRR